MRLAGKEKVDIMWSGDIEESEVPPTSLCKFPTVKLGPAELASFNLTRMFPGKTVAGDGRKES